MRNQVGSGIRSKITSQVAAALSSRSEERLLTTKDGAMGYREAKTQRAGWRQRPCANFIGNLKVWLFDPACVMNGLYDR